MRTPEQFEVALRHQFLPPPSVIWWRWARDGGIILGPRVPTAMHGAFDLMRTPWLIGVAEAMDEPDTVTMVSKKGAQIGISQLIYCYFAALMLFDPAPTMMVAPNEKMAKQKSRNTMKPIFEDSPQLAKEIKPGRESWTDLEYQFRRGHLYWVGGQSPSGLSSNPICRLHLDEENKYQDSLDEGDNSALAIERTKTFKTRRKIIRTCTPTGADGRISVAYEKGDKRRFHAPCPHCRHRQTLRWEQVKDKDGRDWHDMHAADAAEDARYFCESCAKPWTDMQRVDAIDAASKLPDRGWIVTGRASEKGTISFHMPSLISGFISISDMVAKFLNAKDTPSELRNFVNSWLAEDWTPEVIRVSDTALENCKAGYKLGQSPETCPQIAETVKGLPFRIIAHGDVQKLGIWACTRAVWKGGHSALLGYAFIPGDAPFAKYDEFARIEYTVGGIKSGAHLVSIDVGDGNRTMEIYNACIAFKFIAAKGANRALPLLFEEKEWNPDTGRSGQGIGGLYFDTGGLKHNLAAMLNRTRVLPAESFAAGERLLKGGPQFWIPSDTPKEYRDQILSEEFNVEKGLWEPKKGKAGAAGNHLWDCETNIEGVAVATGLCFHVERQGKAKEKEEPEE